MNHPTSINKYKILRHLGSGQFGSVYHAFDQALNAEKAIKVITVPDPAHLLLVIKEGQILYKCKHDNIVMVNEANIFDVNGTKSVVIDLEYCSGGSVESALNSRPITIRESINIMTQVIAGIEYAHRLGVIHRDIKPANILISNGTAKLSDFGLASQVPPGGSGSGRGYNTHLPPEYYSTRTTNIQSDVYAAGVTLYRMINGITDWWTMVQAFPNSRNLIVNGGLIKRIGYQGHVPKKIIAIINKATHIDSRLRYKTAHEFSQALIKLRYNIDWIKAGIETWKGYHEGREHKVEVVDCDVVYTVNGRRKSDNCKSFTAKSSAIAFQNELIANSTIH